MKSIALATNSFRVGVPALAMEPPLRKSGIWETRSTGDEGEAVARRCVGSGTDEVRIGAMAGGADSNVTKAATGLAVETECTIGPVAAVGTSVLTVDFREVELTEGMAGLNGAPGQLGPAEHLLVVEAESLGDGRPGQRPGDITVPDGEIASMTSVFP